MIKTILSKFKQWSKTIFRQEVLFYYFIAVLILPNILLSITESLTFTERVCNVLLPLGCYYLIASSTRRLGLSIWILCPISILAGFQIVLLDIYGRSVIASDMFLNFVTTDANESTELLGNIFKILIAVVIMYVVPIVIATVLLVKKKRLDDSFIKKNRNIAIGTVVTGLSLLCISCVSSKTYSVKYDLYPINAFYNMYEAGVRYNKLSNYQSTSRDFKFNSKSSHTTKNREIYVVVLGETSRATNWELCGYNRQTNPLLKKVDNLVVFDSVLTESNITHKCVPMLLSSASAADYDNIYKQKSLITAFKEAGFKTAYFSNQAHTRTLIDFFGLEADECVYTRDKASNYNPYDMEFVENVRRIINEGAEKQLIVLHAYGSHYDYVGRYPKEYAHFLPDGPSSPNKEFLPLLVNAYDNSIRYTDAVLNEIISVLKSEVDAYSSLMYVSDHGEDLFDDGRNEIFHSSTIPSYYQIHVPMIVWVSDNYKMAYPHILTSLKSNAHKQISSSASFFHTVLNVAGIESTYRDDSYSVANDAFIERERLYLNEHYEGVSLLSIDMREADCNILKKF